MEETEFVLNRKKIRIKVCCASCDNYQLIDGAHRKCKILNCEVSGGDHCNQWGISEAVNNMGGYERGHVKRPEYIAWMGECGPKLQALGWTDEQLREHWERQNGKSVYL